jgi:hypothetical protein
MEARQTSISFRVGNQTGELLRNTQAFLHNHTHNRGPINTLLANV